VIVSSIDFIALERKAIYKPRPGKLRSRPVAFEEDPFSLQLDNQTLNPSQREGYCRWHRKRLDLNNIRFLPVETDSWVGSAGSTRRLRDLYDNELPQHRGKG